MGRLVDATSDVAQAASVDPLSASIASDYGNILLWSGDLEGAEEQFERARSLDFGFGPALLGSAMVALEKGQEVGLQMSLTQWAAVSGVPVPLAQRLARGMMAHHETGEPQEAPDGLDRMGEEGRLRAGTVAVFHALHGDDESALRWLRTSIDDRTWVGLYLRVNPAFDDLRGEPAFEDILEAVGA
jgi:hypothetical protein